MTEIYPGDCLELMKNIPDHSVDMVLCDLPYGMTRNAWDVPIPLEMLWEQYRRICKAGAPVILHGQQPFTTDLITSNRRDFKYVYYWNKHTAGNFLNAKIQPLRLIEEICVFYTRQPVYHPPVKRRERPSVVTRGVSSSSNYGRQPRRGGQQMYDTVTQNNLLDFGKRPSPGSHPTAKPIELLEHLILTYTDPGAIVLDNCMGSGSTGVACINTGRNFIGIEKDPEYYEVAKARLVRAADKKAAEEKQAAEKQTAEQEEKS